MHVVDAHSHLYPRRYVELLKGRREIPRVVEHPDGVEEFVIFPEEKETGGRPLDPSFWDVDAKLAFMDGQGIDRSVVSLGNPWLDPFDGADSLELARDVNGELAGLEAHTGGRLCALGVLPADSVAAATKAAEEVRDTPSLYGLAGGCRICGMPLDAEALDALWSVLASCGLPLLVHPHSPAAADDLAGYGRALHVSLGFTFETTIAVARLVMGGVLQRFPGLRIFAAHGGGTLPFLAARLDMGWQSDPVGQRRLPEPPSGDLSRLYLDAVVYHARGVRAAADLVGTGQLVYGTDHPFVSADAPVSRDVVEQALDGEPRAEVLGQTAVSLFRLPDVSES